MPVSKFKLNRAQMKEVRLRFSSLTSKQLFDHMKANFSVDCQYTTFRTYLYEKGLYKCQMRRWNPEEVKVLHDNYKSKGNIEIAAMLSTRRRKFTKKQVEKKMKLDGLKRTAEEKAAIIQAHKASGVYHEANLERWKEMKKPEGHKHINVLNGAPKWVIKVNGTYVHYARHRYVELHGAIPKGYKVYHKDMNPLNIDDDNLILRKGAGLSGPERLLYRRNCEKYMKSLRGLVTTPVEAVPVLPLRTAKTVSIRIDNKTVISVKPGTDLNALKQKYADHMSVGQQLERLSAQAKNNLPQVNK